MERNLKNLPLISIITVSLNAKEFIEQTISSVLFQSYKHIEYIIIDGGSTDGTTDIIRRYGRMLAYWHSRKDRGLAHAFNLGYEHSHGDWLLYINSDDFLLNSDVIEKMVQCIVVNSDADVVFGNTLFMTHEKKPKLAALRRIFGQPWRWNEFRLKDTIPHQSSLTNRKYFEQVGVFSENFQIAFDYELFLRRGSRLKAVFTPLPVSGMRIGGASDRLLPPLAENRKAQIATRALSPIAAWLNFFWLVAFRYFGRIIFKRLGPFSSKFKWPGRNSGGMINNSL